MPPLTAAVSLPDLAPWHASNELALIVSDAGEVLVRLAGALRARPPSGHLLQIEAPEAFARLALGLTRRTTTQIGREIAANQWKSERRQGGRATNPGWPVWASLAPQAVRASQLARA